MDDSGPVTRRKTRAAAAAEAAANNKGDTDNTPLSPVSSIGDDDAAMRNAPSLSFSGSTHQLSSPWIPTTPEIFLFLVYPTILLVGSVFGALSLPARLAPYSPVKQSFYPAHLAPSYFALKSNIFNVFFVKIGWFWVTAAFLVFWLLHASLGRPFDVTTKRRARALLRWGAVTTWWFLVTQWAAGPSLIDRGFKLTGGKCVSKIEEVQERGAAEVDFGTLASAIACKAAGGSWSGGHDISGHVFLLMLGSAFLTLEILPGVLRGRGMRDKRAIVLEDGSVKSAASQAAVGDFLGTEWGRGVGKVLGFAIGVISLSWWMLLMTAIYFHTWFEKTTGLITAVTGLWLVFFLPRISPTARKIIGMPGI